MKRALQLFATSKSGAFLLFLLAVSLAFKPIRFFEIASAILLFFLILNILAAIFLKFSHKLSRVPFILAHMGAIFIILGGTLSYFFSTEFEVEILEQETIFSSSIRNKQEKALPFSIKLSDARKIDDLSNRMAIGFESDIEIEDVGRGIIKKGTVKLNNPVRYRGYSVIQKYYMGSSPEGMSFLIKRDPGVVFFYCGFVGLFLGMFHLFFKRPLSKSTKRIC